MKKFVTVMTITLLVLISLVGCGSGSFSIIGAWTDVDGTTRVFYDDGTCRNVSLIDIGGPSPTYILSEEENDGAYSMYVEQGGYNGMNLFVKVDNDDHILIYQNESDASPLYDLTRQ